MGRAPCCDKSKVKRGPWSPEEDATLKNYLNKHGSTDNWIALPTKAVLNRCGKSCRLRWLNYLRPNINRGGFTEEEDDVICTLYSSIGSRWSVIASQLPGRTDNDVKNYWNTKLKKKPLASARRSNHVATRNTNDFNKTQLSASVPPKIETSHYVPESTPSCFGDTLPYLKQDFGPSCDLQSSHVKPIKVAGVGNSESNSLNNPMPSQEVSILPISFSLAQLDQYPIYHCTLLSGYDGFKTNNSEFVGFGFESTPPAGDHYLLDGFGY